MRFLVPLATRALPMLLLFVTFLFINTEVWQMATNLAVGTALGTVLLMLGLAVLFLVVRLPEEVDRVDDEVDDDVRRARVRRYAAGGGEPGGRRRTRRIDPQDHAQVAGFERGTSSWCCWSSRPSRCCCSR